MTTPDVPAETGPSHPVPLAEWADRVVATLIDFAFVFFGWIVLFVVTLIIGAVSDTLAALVGFAGWVVLSLAWLYFGYMEGMGGQSPGKRIRGLKVVSMQGELLGGGMGVLRKFAHIIDGICFIGYVLPLFDEKNQTFADKIVDTVVLKDQETQAFSGDIFKPDAPATPEA